MDLKQLKSTHYKKDVVAIVCKIMFIGGGETQMTPAFQIIIKVVINLILKAPPTSIFNTHECSCQGWYRVNRNISLIETNLLGF